MVKELIAFLEKLPKDTVIGVIYTACSDYQVLEEGELNFFNKTDFDEQDEEAKILGYRRHRRFVYRHGKIMEYNERTWDKKETPVFVPLLVFPGN